MSRSAAVHLLNVALLAGLLAASLWVWPDLPDRIPGRVDFSGRVTRWSDPSLWSWLLLPLVAVGTAALQYGIAALLDERPHLFNTLEKDRFLQLPPERQRPIIRLMKRFLHESATVLILLMAAHQWLRYHAAVNADTGNETMMLLVVSAFLMPLVLFIWLVPIQAEIREQWKMHLDETRGAIR